MPKVISKLTVGVAALFCLCLLAPARAEMTGVEKIQASKTEFRVCADPDNLPFSNRQGDGFENKIAARLAQAAGQPLVYDWWPARRGFVGRTLNAWDCDVVIGVPAGYELTATTQPYYCSSYVMVYRRGEHIPADFLDEPAARRLRVGVIERTPPLDLALRHHVNPVVYFTDYGYRGNFPGRIIRDLADGKIDVALVWGPIGNYFAQHQNAALDVAPVVDAGGIRLAFPIAMGVRHGDKARIARLDALLQQNAQAIDSILTDYGVPLAHDAKDCSPGHQEAAPGAATPVRPAAAQGEDRARSSDQPAAPAGSSSAPDAASAPSSRASAAQPDKSAAAGQTVPCKPTESLQQVLKDIPGPSSGQQSGGGTERPYVVKGGKLGPKTYEGWVRFSAFCERCHGPGGIGSALAPDLAVAVKGLSHAQFEHIVRCGLTGNIGAGVMPPWGANPNIAPYIDDLWSYLQARADGAVGPGRPEKLAAKQ